MSERGKAFERYAECLFITLEGAKSNSPIDPGGLTTWGFAAKTRDRLGLPERMTLGQAKDALWTHWWLKHRCDRLPELMAWLVCDAKFNHGTLSSNRIIQAAVGADVDGKWGSKSEAALQAAIGHERADAFVARYLNQRRYEYTRRTRELAAEYANDAEKLDQVWTQAWGWQNRLDRLNRAAWKAGFIRPPMSETAVNTTTTVAAVTAATAAVTATALPDGAGVLADVAINWISSVNPALGSVAAVAGGWAARWWAKRRGKL